MSALVLAAEDAEDLEVISARLQDAVAQIEISSICPGRGALQRCSTASNGKAGRGDSRAFGAAFRRRAVGEGAESEARRSPMRVVSLLAIRFTPKGGEDPGGTIELVFSGGGAIRLEVECIDAGLNDVSGEWAARGRPLHEGVRWRAVSMRARRISKAPSLR